MPFPTTEEVDVGRSWERPRTPHRRGTFLFDCENLSLLSFTVVENWWLPVTLSCSSSGDRWWSSSMASPTHAESERFLIKLWHHYLVVRQTERKKALALNSRLHSDVASHKRRLSVCVFVGGQKALDVWCAIVLLS